MKIILCFCLLGLILLGCNQVTDLQPTPPEQVPTQAIDAVTGQFPQAEDMVFTTLERNRVWQAAFRQKAIRYTAATNQQMLLVAYELDSRSLPDSLTRLVGSTVISGGTFTSPRIQKYTWFTSQTATDQTLLADYTWQGNRYTFRWVITTLGGQTTYTIEMLPYWQLEYRTVTLADLPNTIQESLKSQQTDFQYATVQLAEQTKKRYSILARQNNNLVTLTYSDEGSLLAASSPQNAQRISDISQLPAPIQTYLSQTPELADFKVAGQFSSLTKTTYNGLDTYSVNVQKGRQTWFMTFSGSGQLITRSYLNLV